MDRRSFLGSVIGLWAGSDFFARTLAEPPQIIEPSIEDYQLFFRDSLSGFTIRAPGIKDIDSKYEHWAVVAHPLKVKRVMRLDQLVLTDKSGVIQRSCRFNCPAYTTPGDSLMVTYELYGQGLGTSDFDTAFLLVPQLDKV